MEQQTLTQPLKVDRTKLMTQSAYAKKMAISKQRVNQMVAAGQLNTIKIDGATLIYIG